MAQTRVIRLINLGMVTRFACLLVAAGLSAADACTFADQKFQVNAYGSYVFCCKNLDGTVAQPVNSTFQSVTGDSYAYKVGLASDPNYCDSSPDKQFPDNDFSDAFDHTVAQEYSGNFVKESVVVQFWCHNIIQRCNIVAPSIVIGSGDGVGETKVLRNVAVEE